jgi:heme/copper-type cytochrome/quinol oxidase subunit 3
MLLFLGTDFMLFAGLIGAFLVFRFGTESWPPFGQPRLPLLVTTINSLILLCSGVTMALAWRALSKVKALRYLLLTMVLGVVFLGIQGLEWMRLIQFGLSLRSSVYGGIFYILIGCHALHVAAAVLWLIVLAIRSSFASAARTSAIKLAGMYWFLVVALWPLLFGFVYL